MNPFYVSDSFSLDLPGDVTHHPGVMNQDAAYGPGVVVMARLWSASLALTILPIYGDIGNPNSGINVDIQLGFYDVASGAAIFTGPILGFASPYGGALNGQIINHSAKIDTAPVSARDWAVHPLTVKGTTPTAPGQYMLGPVMKFHNGVGHVHGHYQYHLHGFSEPEGSVQPVPGPSGSIILTMPDGSRYAVEATLIG